MHETCLRKVGGSIMLAVPPAILDLLGWTSGAEVAVGVEDGRLIVAPRARRRYRLDELIAQCDPNAALGEADCAWLESPAVGSEIAY